MYARWYVNGFMYSIYPRLMIYVKKRNSAFSLFRLLSSASSFYAPCFAGTHVYKCMYVWIWIWIWIGGLEGFCLFFVAFSKDCMESDLTSSCNI